MTEYLPIDKADTLICPFNTKPCTGVKCPHWLFKKDFDSKIEKKIANPAFGMCGWIGVIYYFNERAEVK